MALLLFASCGRQQQAKSVVKKFMSQQLDKQDVSYLDFTDLDSTHALSDSVIQSMHQRGKQGVNYLERKHRTLLYLRAQYLQDSDTLSTTFYLDPEATGIVAYKENY
jgi:hypothetical protein